MFGAHRIFGFLSRNLVLPVCILLHISLAFGQSIGEFKEIWVNESKEYLLNNQIPLPYFQSGFHYFSRVQDNILTEGLQSAWDKFTAVPGAPVPKSRKFEKAPQFNFDETSYHDPRFLPCFISEKSENSWKKSPINLPRIRKPAFTTSNPLKLNFKFFGNNIAVTYDKILSLPVDQPLTKEIVADYWKKFIVANSNHLVNQLNALQNRLGLNDWGYFLLTKACANALYPNNESGETLLTWALMIRSGYEVKIGFNQLGCLSCTPPQMKYLAFIPSELMDPSIILTNQYIHFRLPPIIRTIQELPELYD